MTAQDPDGRRVDCCCPRAAHQHGTYEARKRDGCGCGPCVQAGRRYEKRRDHLRRTGRSSLVDAQPVRDHVHRLLDAGVTRGQIEQRSGVHRTAIRHLLGTGSDGRLAAARIRRDTADRLLAVTTARVGGETSGLVDPAGTSRRLQALVAVGWTQSALAIRLEMLPANFSRLIRGNHPVRIATRDAVRALYDELWNQSPADTTPSQRRARTQALGFAATRGWPPPQAWDDDLIDDPDARSAVQQLPRRAGKRARWEPEDVEFLLDTGADLTEILSRLQIGRLSSLQTLLQRRGRRDLWLRLSASGQARRTLPRRVA